MVSLATVLRVILPAGPSADQRHAAAACRRDQLVLIGSDPGRGAEARLPELLLRLKNGDPSERVRYQRIRDLFTEFTQGRGCEVRLIQAQQPAQDGQGTTAIQVPAIWVTVNTSAGPAGLAPEVPIEFAGAGAWEALVLASVLGEPSASVVVLDEPAVALHPSLQRQLGAHLLNAPAQFLVITHSAELLPLADATDVRLVRLDRDGKNATRAWPVDESCRVKMARKLAAKGNERLPFAWRAILCEGQDDVEAIMTLAERMSIDLRRRNIAIADCGGRDNLPDYIWFCAELGLKYLAVMDADSSKPDALLKAQAVRDAVAPARAGNWPSSRRTSRPRSVSSSRSRPSCPPRSEHCPSPAACQTQRRFLPRSPPFRRQSSVSRSSQSGRPTKAAANVSHTLPGRGRVARG